MKKVLIFSALLTLFSTADGAAKGDFINRKIASTDAVVSIDGFSFQIDEPVVCDNGAEGVITGFFPNGDISIRFLGAPLHMSPHLRVFRNRLAKKEGCSSSLPEYCVGINIYDDVGNSGTVTGIFSDGRVAFTAATDTYGVHFDAQPTQLGLKQGCTSDHYCAGDRVVHETLQSGKIMAVYSDGDVAVKFDLKSHGDELTDKLSTSKLALSK